MTIRDYIQEEQNESCSAYKITASVLVVLCALVFGVLMIYSYKFFKIYRFKSKCLALFLIMINLSVLTRMGNFIQELIVRKDSCTNEPPICLDSPCSTYSTGSTKYEKSRFCYQTARTINKYLDVCLVVLVFCLAAVFVSLIVSSCSNLSDNRESIISVFSIVFCVAYFLMAVSFATTCWYYITTLKLFSFSRAQIMKPRAVLSAFLICIPFCIRGCFLIYSAATKFEEEFVMESLKNNSMWLPIFLVSYYLSVDILPLGAQMISLKIVIDHYYRRLNTDPSCTPIRSLPSVHKNRDLNSECYRESSGNSMFKSMFESKHNNEDQSEDSHLIDSVATSH